MVRSDETKAKKDDIKITPKGYKEDSNNKDRSDFINVFIFSFLYLCIDIELKQPQCKWPNLQY